VNNLCYAAISLLLRASPKKTSKSGAHSNGHTDELFTRKWACLFGVCKRRTLVVYCIRQGYSFVEYSRLNFSAIRNDYNAMTAYICRRFCIDYSFSSVPPVLWTTSCLPINGSYGAWLIRRIHKVTHQGAEAGRSVMPTIVLSTFAAIRRYAAVAAAPIGLLPLRVLLDSCFFLRCHDNRRTLVTCNICATSAQQ